MWSVSSLTNLTSPVQQVSFSDGLPLNAVRGGAGNCFRLIVNGKGFLDITDTGHQTGGPHYWQLVINGNIYWYDGQGSISLTVYNNGTFSISGDGNNFSGILLPMPIVSAFDAASLDWMMQQNYVPYQNIPDEPGKTNEEIAALGAQFFPFTPFSFQLAMSVYDWTTADFARIQFMQLFAYTGVPGPPLSEDEIADAIWTSSWGTYVPSNVDYMNSFMMQPAYSYEEVRAQLDQDNKANVLYENNLSEVRLIMNALSALPPTSCMNVPALYSGQVDISNLGTSHFATYYTQFPNNNDASLPPLQMPLDQAFDTFIQKGNYLTLKSFMSFTDSQQDAMNYSNGILVTVVPPQGSVYWKDTAYITPLSDGPEKTEYLFPPGSQFLVSDIFQSTVNEKPIWQVQLQLI